MQKMIIPVVGLVNEKNEILLASRKKGAFKAGKLELPGGKMDAGEYPKDTAIREMKEELGVEIAPENLEETTFICNAFPEIERFCVVLVYLCKKWQGEPQGLEGQTLRWVTLTEIETAFPDFLEENEEMLLRVKNLGIKKPAC